MKNLNEFTKMKEQEEIHALCYNTKTGQIYVYPKGDEYKKFPLYRDAIGYFFKRNKTVERIDSKLDINKIKEYINN